VLPTKTQDKYALCLSIFTTAGTGMIHSFGDVAGSIVGAIGGHLGHGFTEEIINYTEKQTETKLPKAIKFSAKFAGSLLGSMAGATTGRAMHNAIINPWFLGANGQMMTSDTRISEQIHEDNCVNKPALVLDQRSIELSDLQNILLHENGTSKQAISFTYGVDHDYYFKTFNPTLRGVVKITKNGKFLAAWETTAVPFILNECSHFSDNLKYSFIYSSNTHQLDSAINSAQICSYTGSFYRTESFNQVGGIIYNNANITVPELNSAIFVSEASNPDLFYNRAIHMKYNAKIFGNNINCHVSDIEDHMLFCISPNYSNYFTTDPLYASSPTDLNNKILPQYCHCPGATIDDGAPKGMGCPIYNPAFPTEEPITEPISILNEKESHISIGFITSSGNCNTYNNRGCDSCSVNSFRDYVMQKTQ
ncbi:MAG: hypothetical protein HAW62_06175, partial [Endozoicomonadaceae bacterium]|nr:hypothetical protein [Endozoicomonadaceae bacterium]